MTVFWASTYLKQQVSGSGLVMQHSVAPVAASRPASVQVLLSAVKFVISTSKLPPVVAEGWETTGGKVDVTGVLTCDPFMPHCKEAAGGGGSTVSGGRRLRATGPENFSFTRYFDFW